MNKKIIIPYFPKELKYSTPLILGGAIFLFFIHWLFWPIVLVIFCILIFTTNYVTEIDLNEKRYDDYISLLGFHVSKESNRFQKLDRIVITKANHAKTLQTRVQSRQINWSDYTGTLLMDNRKTLDLITRTNKAELIKGVKDLAEFLEVGVEDRSTPHHYWVDLKKV